MATSLATMKSWDDKKNIVVDYVLGCSDTATPYVHYPPLTDFLLILSYVDALPTICILHLQICCLEES